MGRIAFVFSGQGDQFPGMGKNLYENYTSAKKVFDACDEIRPDTSRQCFEGTEEELKETKNTQPCLFAMELAAASVLEEHGIKPDTPILMLTALETIDDKERGFGAGADDYLTKPFALKELLLRLKALLRRYGEVCENKIILPHTELNYQTNAAVINGMSIELTKKEFMLLFKLLSHPNMIFSREQLIYDLAAFLFDNLIITQNRLPLNHYNKNAFRHKRKATELIHAHACVGYSHITYYLA